MKALKILVSVARILSVFGMGIGVLFIILSYRFNSNYEDFKKNGILVDGLITNLYDNGNLRYTSYFVDVNYFRVDINDQKHAVKAERIEVYFKAARKLHIGNKIALYYKKTGSASDVILAVNFENQYVPLSRKPFWGWGITIGSTLVFFSYQIGRKFKKLRKQ